MKVSELIKKLQEYQPDTDVIFSGDTGYGQKIEIVTEAIYPYRFDAVKGAYVHSPTVVVELICDENSEFSCSET